MEGKALVATLFGGKKTVPDYENVRTAAPGAVAAWGRCCVQQQSRVVAVLPGS